MHSNLYIPKQIHVGFQNLFDTFTGKLGYVIFKDNKGILKYEKSWNNWRNSSIEPIILDNIPSRFVFNKGVQRHGYFASSRSLIRVYDNRDFEFEIKIDNLIGILMHSDVCKRDIMEECVFAWSGKNLVLLPVNSQEYRESIEFTNKQSQSLSSKELIKGHVYELKNNNDHFVYIGYDHFYDVQGYYHDSGYHESPGFLRQIDTGKKHIFYNLNHNKFITIDYKNLAKKVLCEVHPLFSSLHSDFYRSIHAYKIVDLHIHHNPEYNLYLNGYHYFFKLYYLQKNESEFYQFRLCKQGNNPNDNTLKCLKFNVENDNFLLGFNGMHQSESQNIFNKIGLDWSFQDEALEQNYLRKKIKGSFYTEKDLHDLLIKAGFVNKMFAKNEQGQLIEINI